MATAPALEESTVRQQSWTEVNLPVVESPRRHNDRDTTSHRQSYRIGYPRRISVKQLNERNWKHGLNCVTDDRQRQQVYCYQTI